MKKSLTWKLGRAIIACLAMVGCNFTDAYAQHEVSVDAARARATSFLQNKTSTRASNALDAGSYQLGYTAQVDSHVGFYVFNRGNNEGFVIVSADDRTSEQILGYSTQGTFDYNKLPANAKAWVDGYAKGIATIQATNQAPAPTRAATRTPSSVAPLLGDIAWDQFAPFNNLCPEVDGEKCPTGCVATAMAQLMYYHRWPEVGHGSHSYDWHGQTLSADFNHEYHWNLLKPYYTGDINVDGVEASEEVAILMRDCGYALDMDYNPGNSGARGLELPNSLAEYFDYDKDIHYLPRQVTTKEHYQNVICEELAQGRPVNVEGNCHSYIFDGYDENDFVHINFGWSGSGNAYYAIDNTGYDNDAKIIYGIRKNEGNQPGFDLFSYDNIYYEDKGDHYEMRFDLYFDQALNVTNSIKAALAYDNQDTHEVRYVVFSEVDNCEHWAVEVTWMFIPEDLSDGNYHIYPVMSVDGSEWLHFSEPENKPQIVYLTVTNGEFSLSNDKTFYGVAPGRVEVDNIYYILNDDRTAWVTWKNGFKNSYSGNVVIPETFTYDGTEYTVTKIDSTAFEYSSKLVSVEIPASVTEIEFAAFNFTSAKSIRFAPGSKLKKIGGWGFNVYQGEEIVLPEGLEELGNAAFQASALKAIDLPASIKFLGAGVFNYSESLTDVTVHWSDPKEFDPYVFNECPITNLYVPKGTKQKYSTIQPWSQFPNIIEEDLNVAEVFVPVVEEGTNIDEQSAEDITEFKMALSNVETFVVNEEANAELLIDGVLKGTAGKDDITEVDGVVSIKFNLIETDSIAQSRVLGIRCASTRADGEAVSVEVIITPGSFNINGEDVEEEIAYTYTATASVVESIEEALSIEGIAAEKAKVPLYNLFGIRVNKDTKGVAIRNGKTIYVR